MRRRDLLACAAALPLLASPAAARPAGPRRRVRPGDAGWPGDADWARLKRQLGGRLIRPQPLWDHCQGAENRPQCLADLKSLLNPFYLGDQPGGTQVSGWQDAWKPALSAYAVAARSSADVARAVDFARRHNLRLVVKGGGHSYLGTSNAPDSLLIWTRAMNVVTLHDAFVPQGCQATPVPAATVGAGAMWIDAYDAVTTRAGRYVQGGGCATVGVAGLIQSGGFGSFSKRFGLASAGLIEAEVVTADGRVRTVNACRDPELFWALKGGGGGSFGVVTKLTLRTHDLPERFGGMGAAIKAGSDDAFRRLLASFAGFYAEALCNPHWGESVKVRPDNVLEFSMVTQGLTTVEADATLKPFFDAVRASPQDYAFKDEPSQGTGAARGWWDVEARKRRGNSAMISDPRPGSPASHAWWQGDGEQVCAFLHGYESVWLPGTLLEPSNRGALADALFAASRHAKVELHLNKGLFGAPPEAIAASRDTAVNPAALTAFALAIIANGGPPPLPGLPGYSADPGAARRDARAVDAANAELRKVAPVPASYLSESNYFNADWATAYWGDNYPRLKSAKAKYDPDGLFIIHHGVGSDAWSTDGFERVG
jgi:FAD/FMN-containing dehydrogenase